MFLTRKTGEVILALLGAVAIEPGMINAIKTVNALMAYDRAVQFSMTCESDIDRYKKADAKSILQIRAETKLLRDTQADMNQFSTDATNALIPALLQLGGGLALLGTAIKMRREDIGFGL